MSKTAESGTCPNCDKVSQTWYDFKVCPNCEEYWAQKEAVEFENNHEYHDLIAEAVAS